MKKYELYHPVINRTDIIETSHSVGELFKAAIDHGYVDVIEDGITKSYGVDYLKNCIINVYTEKESTTLGTSGIAFR